MQSLFTGIQGGSTVSITSLCNHYSLGYKEAVLSASPVYAITIHWDTRRQYCQHHQFMQSLFTGIQGGSTVSITSLCNHYSLGYKVAVLSASPVYAITIHWDTRWQYCQHHQFMQSLFTGIQGGS